jgi:DNA-binding transcriptional regulator PaaX
VSYDETKIDEVVLALLGAQEFEKSRAWKRIDFAAMDRLHKKGFISDPRGRQESVRLTDEGLALAKQLAKRYFGSEHLADDVR